MRETICLPAPGGKTRRACHAPDGAGQGERHHKVVLTRDCRPRLAQPEATAARRASLRALRTRPNTSPLVTPLASPLSMAAPAPQALLRTAVPRAPKSAIRRARPHWRFRGVRVLTFLATKRSSSSVKLTFLVGMVTDPSVDVTFDHHDWQTLPIVRTVGSQSYCGETLKL